MSYYEKYLKYKNKYLNLRKQLGGEITIPSAENPCSNIVCLICREPIESKYTDFIKLTCGCCVHKDCFIDYFLSDFGGTFKFRCFDHDQIELSRDDIIRYFSKLDGTFDASKGITEYQYNRYISLSDPNHKKITDIDTELVASGSAKLVQSSEPYIEATTKKCPHCRINMSHFHGHGCHHISPDTGCMTCHKHFCFKCLSKDCDNISERGSKERCRCDKQFWSTFCQNIETLENIGLEPVPHDKRCGCVFCPECSLGKPCGTCSGDCVVCIGMVPPGVTEIGEFWDISQVNLEARAREDDFDQMIEDDFDQMIEYDETMLATFENDRINRYIDSHVLRGYIDQNDIPELRRIIIDFDLLRLYDDGDHTIRLTHIFDLRSLFRYAQEHLESREALGILDYDLFQEHIEDLEDRQELEHEEHERMWEIEEREERLRQLLNIINFNRLRRYINEHNPRELRDIINFDQLRAYDDGDNTIDPHNIINLAAFYRYATLHPESRDALGILDYRLLEEYTEQERDDEDHDRYPNGDEFVDNDMVWRDYPGQDDERWDNEYSEDERWNDEDSEDERDRYYQRRR